MDARALGLARRMHLPWLECSGSCGALLAFTVAIRVSGTMPPLLTESASFNRTERGLSSRLLEQMMPRKSSSPQSLTDKLANLLDRLIGGLAQPVPVPVPVPVRRPGPS